MFNWIKFVFPFVLWGIIAWVVIEYFPTSSSGIEKTVATIFVFLGFFYHMYWLRENVE